MEQFSLDKWLQDRSRKVVTRLKKPVQIISIIGKDDIPIVALVEGVAHQYKPNGYHADVIATHTNQCLDMGDYDLFFADEEETNKILDELKSYLKNTPKEQVEKDWKEIQDWYAQHFTNEKYNEKEELTEFEKQLGVYIYFPKLSCEFNKEEKKYIRDAANTLLDLARKEIEKDAVGAQVFQVHDIEKAYEGYVYIVSNQFKDLNLLPPNRVKIIIVKEEQQ